MTRLLAIDDDVDICHLLQASISNEDMELEISHDGEEGIERALAGNFDLVVLDVMLPTTNGFDVLRRIRAASSVPILMLTGRDQDIDRILGLELGADDYLSKPFNPRVLIARVRAILRRASPQVDGREALVKPAQLTVGDLMLDTGSKNVYWRGEDIPVTALEFHLLEVLVRSPGRVVSREYLAKEVFGRRFTTTDRSLDVHISRLRKKLDPLQDHQPRIRSVRGEGYLYVMPTETA